MAFFYATTGIRDQHNIEPLGNSDLVSRFTDYFFFPPLTIP